MNFLRTSWYFIKWCADCLRDILLGAAWLALAGFLVLQIGLLSSHHLPVPEWMLRQIESRINAAGLSIQVASATIDPGARVSIKNLQLTPHSLDAPLVRIDEVYLRLNPVALLAGRAEPTYIRATGVNLLLPAMFSPAGRTEEVLSNIELAYKPDPDSIAIEQLSGAVANLTFSVRGKLDLPPRQASAPSQKISVPNIAIAQAIKSYVEIARQLSKIEPELTALENPHLDVQLTPGRGGDPIISFVLTSKQADIDLARFRPEAGRLLISNLRLSTTLSPGVSALTLQGTCAEAHTSKGYQLLGVNFVLKGLLPAGDATSFKPLDLMINADSATQPLISGIDLKNTLAQFSTEGSQPLIAEIITETIGTSWQAKASGDPSLGQGSLKLNGAITPFIIQQLEAKTHMHPNTLLRMENPAPITLTADFSQGWKLKNVIGRATFGPVVGYHVPFSGGTARFSFDGTELSVTDIAATQGDHSAVGSYWMNAKTLDYRFLLTGHLRPLGISGFFSDWWPNFFKLFDFTPAAPAASVDIGGRWTFPYTTSVFVNADAVNATINHVRFDRVRTTMFIRPSFYDALELIVNRGEQTARGTFTRTVDFYRPSDNLRSMYFDLNSTLDLTETAKIFGHEGTATVEPFTFANPPSLRLAGHIDGAAATNGPHRFIQMSLKSTGLFALHGFPLNDLSFTGTIKDDAIDLTAIQASYARGLAQGHAYLSGPEAERQLSFDVALKGAYVGEAMGTVEQFIATQRDTPPTLSNRFQQLHDLRMNFQLTAKGLYHDLLSYQGQGSMDLSGAQLAKINLLGSLSRALSQNSIFSFTSLELNKAQSNFVLDREKLSLPDLKISGNSAIIEASGTYFLDKKTMAFTAKLYPFGQGKTLFSNAVGFVLVPLSNAFGLKLSGTLEQPNWRFTYGPRNFLYNITGTNPNEAAAIPEQTPTDITRKLPPPYLRR